MKARSIIARVLVVFITLIVSLVIAEAVYSRLEPRDQRWFYYRFLTTVEYDPVLGWKNKANASDLMEGPSFSITVRTNSHGMRYRELDDSPGFKVAVLGDSIAWGWGVEEGERFTDVLEKDLDVKMLNFAAPCYSPVHYYLQMDEVLSHKPDMVLLTFTLRNDFDNVVDRCERELIRQPYAELVDGKLNITGYPVPNYRDHDKRRNWLSNIMFRYALGRASYRVLEAKAPKLFKAIFISKKPPAPPFAGITQFNSGLIFSAPDSPWVKQAADVNKEVLRAIKDKCDAAGVPLVIFAARTRLESNENAYKLLKPQADELGIEMVYSPVNYRDNGMTIGADNHWTPKGHVFAAELVRPTIARYKERDYSLW